MNNKRTKFCSRKMLMTYLREHSNITSACWRGVGGLTEIADAADVLRGGDGGSQVKIADVILEQIF